MNTRPLLASFLLLSPGLGRPLWAADSPAPTRPGYTVVLDMKIDEQGAVEDAKVFKSEDATFDHVLDRLAFEQARALKLPVHQQDGHPVKYTARAPFVFPIEGDGGPESNSGPKPMIHAASKPVYPPELAAKGEVGGVIVNLLVDATGKVAQLVVVRSSHPEFAQATELALKQWKFTPATLDGKPVESRFNMAVPFMTDVAVPDWKWRFAPRPSIGSYSVMHRTLPLTPPPTEPPAATPAPPPAPGK